jgi:anti-anti-sigma factor
MGEPNSPPFSLYRIEVRCEGAKMSTTLTSKEMVIEVEQKGEVCLLRCEGRFVAGTDPQYLRAKRDEVNRLRCKKVLADFREVSDIGSAGIGFIVGIYTSTRDSGGRFIVVGLRPRVRELFDLTRVSTIIPLAPDVASGLAVLGKED